jgi:hypothetical protein
MNITLLNLVSADGNLASYSPKHMKAHKEVLPFLEEAIQKLSFVGFSGFFSKTIEMGRSVGGCDCVQTSDADVAFYEKRPGRRWMSRFVRGREPDPCSKITVIGTVNGDSLRVISAWIGGPAPREEGDSSIDSAADRKISQDFWSTHALIKK